MRQILVVDDDKEIVQLISFYLQNEGYKVIRAYNGKDALDIFHQEEIDLIVLDVMMPEVDGIEVCRAIRETYHVPILMISAKTEDMDKITGLMSGADDYVAKPFNPLELIARVKTLLRRAYFYQSDDEKNNMIKVDALEINKTFHTVKVRNKLIQLTSKEFDILLIMVTNLGRVYSGEEIYQLVWKEKYYSSNNTVMVHMSNLREKLERELGYKLIKTIWGVGYKIDA
ncbi:response regulator transcription factor [Metabacillus litoralis]|uniref:response regulator transcription factor n=1 Tax=Metabacillus litoralis TaxID=152268 RepID=UPI00203DAA39|nr:response regulator transcription factor [Metabacillus litoralis]MCM3164775.1 response regulator transcription factor [Metabacillus litoralis]